MKLAIAQRILCRLAGSANLTEQVIAGFTAQGAIRLAGGDVIRPAWVVAVITG